MSSYRWNSIVGLAGIGLLMAGVTSLFGCASGGAVTRDGTLSVSHMAEFVDGEPAAVAKIEAKSGSKVSGTAEFYPLGDGRVRAIIKISELTQGLHGLHLHEKGDCSSSDGKSAGGHWNPGNSKHGGPGMAEHHAGDFGNIEADRNGYAEVTVDSGTFTLEGPDSVIGHAIVVHGGPDDMSSQPSGNSGPRVGCGVIEAP